MQACLKLHRSDYRGRRGKFAEALQDQNKLTNLSSFETMLN